MAIERHRSEIELLKQSKDRLLCKPYSRAVQEEITVIDHKIAEHQKKILQIDRVCYGTQ